MISSTTTTTSSDDNNNNVSLSVVQTVKKWIRNSWPFATTGKIDERRPDNDDAARQEGEVLYIHQDECASVDDATVLDGDRRYDEACGDDNEESGDVAVEDYGSKEARSASLSNEQHDNDNDDYKAGSRVMDIVMASPKKYFLRSSRRRRSCRFQLDDDKIDVVARSSNDDERVMAGGHFGGLNDIDGVNSSKVSSMTSSHDDRSKQDNDDNDKQVEELAVPTLPQDTTTTNHSCWTQQEITSLRKAYQQSNPTSPTLWQDISTAMNNSNIRSASECQRKWFSLVATPKKRVGRRKNGRVVNDTEKKYGVEEDGSEEEDDLFDSTPLKCAVQEIENGLLFQHHRRSTAAAATTSAAAKKQELLEQDDNNDTSFHSPNKIMTKMIKSPLSKRPRMFSPKNKNNINGGMKNDGILSPLINRRKGYNTYVNNLRREIGRAQKARMGDDDEKMSRDENIVGRCGNNSGRGGRGKGGGSTANKSSSTIRIKEGKGKSQLSAELLVDGSSFVLNIPQEDSDDENGSDVDLFEEVFRMEDEENEFPCD